MTLKTSKPARNGTGSDGICLAASGQINTETLPQFQAEIQALRAFSLSRRFGLAPVTAKLVAELAFSVGARR